jgi:methylated-DNA-protein-cysteine methyltransferase-like protein
MNFMKDNFFQLVYIMVKKVPRGKVATYGQIAKLCGSPHASRAVGYALHVNPEPGIIPCHRIVNRFGGLAPAFAFGGQNVQKRLLVEEGVAVDKNYFVDMDKYKWST